MAEEHTKLLVDLEVRIKQVLFLCDSLKEENVRLKAEIRSGRTRLDETAKEMEQLKAKYDSLKVARTITAASVDVDTAKTTLSKLVREVDKCINLLK
jgi:phage shock protein A